MLRNIDSVSYYRAKQYLYKRVFYHTGSISAPLAALYHAVSLVPFLAAIRGSRGTFRAMPPSKTQSGLFGPRARLVGVIFIPSVFVFVLFFAEKPGKPCMSTLPLVGMVDIFVAVFPSQLYPSVGAAHSPTDRLC